MLAKGLASVACVFLLFSCSVRAPGSKKDRIVNFTQCILPADQGKGSFQGAWAALPIPVVFDRDFYVADNGEIMNSLRGSVTTWNTWAGLRGMRGAFSIVNDGTGNTSGRDIPELTDCAQASYSSSVTDAVGIWKIATSGFHKNQRDSCGTNGKILPDGVQGQTDWIIVGGKIVGASILLNFEGFNAPGKQPIDSESLLLHELGHVLGLLHSCNGSSGDSIDGTTAPHCGVAREQYVDAVMFPFLEVSQNRRNLGQNDYNRINCIY